VLDPVVGGTVIPPTNPPAPDLFWRFEETSGTRFDEIAGFPLLPLQEASIDSTSTAAGRYGICIARSSSKDSAYFNGNLIGSGTRWSAGCWVYYSGFDKATNICTACIGLAPNRRMWQISTSGTIGGPTQNLLVQMSTDGINWISIGSGVSIALNGWHTVLWGWDGANLWSQIDNGALNTVASAVNVLAPGERVYVLRLPSASGGPAFAQDGVVPMYNISDDGFLGSLDCLCWWKIPLNAADRTAWWNGGAGKEWRNGAWFP